MSKMFLKRSIVIVLLMLLFVTGIYIGNNNSYSISVQNTKDLESNLEEDVLILNSFSFAKDKAKAGDKVPVKIDTSGAKIYSATVQLVRDDGKYTLSLIVEDLGIKPYFELPLYINNGNYNIKSVLIVAYNSNETTFTKNFTTKPTGNGDVAFEFGKGINLEANVDNVDIDLIKSIKLERSTFTQGEKVNVSIEADKDVRAVRLNFSHSDSYSGIYSYVNSINKNPYIVLAKSAKLGDYVLDNIYVETYNYGSVIYKNFEEEGSKYLEYDSNYVMLEANSENSTTVYYNNADINNSVISSFKNSEIINEIYIIAHDEPVVSSEVFASLKGSNKRLHVIYKDIEYVFEGQDIKNAKMFDSTSDVKLSKNDKNINTDGLVVKLSGGGALPGKARVIVKENSLFAKAFDKNIVNIYLYSEKNNSYTLVSEDVKLTDKSYKFDIEESSTYLLTNSKLDNVKKASSALSNSDNNDSNNGSKLNNILLIILCLLAIILIFLILILFKKKDNGEVKKEIKEASFEEVKEELTDDISEEEIIENIAKANEESIDDDE